MNDRSLHLRSTSGSSKYPDHEFPDLKTGVIPVRRLERMLVYVDDVSALNGILERISEIVEGTQCRVVFASVVEPIPWGLAQAVGVDTEGLIAAQSQDLASQIEATVDVLRQRGFDVEEKVYTGEPTRALVNAVVDGKFDLLVKASHDGVSGPAGGQDQRLLRHCPCPVAILRPHTDDKSRIIMAAVEMNPDDPSDSSINDVIMDVAIHTAIGYFRHLVVVHAWYLHGESMLSYGFARLSPDKLEHWREKERQRHQTWLQEYVGGYINRLGPEAERYLKPEVRLIYGVPTQALQKQVEIEKPELLVLGSVARTGIRGLLIGNTAEGLVRTVDCSTLTVKPLGFESPLTN